MTLRVVGPTAFAGQVIAQLKVICPCREPSLAADQTVVLADSLACTCPHGAGCHLVSLLVEGAHLVRIAGPSTNSTYSRKTQTISLFPTQQIGSCDGRPCAPPAVTLAHELTHAFLDLYDPVVPETELNASRGENQIRKELGIAPRCCYGMDEVPLTDGVIPEDWVPDDPFCPPGAVDVASEFREALWTLRWSIWNCVQEAMGKRTCSTSSSQARFQTGEDEIYRRIDHARRYRNRLPVARRADRAGRRLRAGSGLFLHIEQAAIDAGLRVLMLKFDADVVTAVANVGPDLSGTRLVPLGDLLLYRFSSGPEAPFVASVPEFPEGYGGDASVSDGLSTWLTVRDEATRRAAYYGFNNLTDPGPSPARTDRADWLRWEAVNQVMESWIALSRETPLSVERA